MQDAESSDEVYVVLLHITHPDIDEPVLLSTDNTERLSDEPLMYGTRSTWMDATDPYLFVLASALVPGDLDDAPAAATLILENVDNDIAKVLRSVTTPATVAIAVVLASSPSLLEAEWIGMRMVSADGDASEVSLEISREEIEEEHSPGHRMTKDFFPGLFA
jgi:hypothetical protein